MPCGDSGEGLAYTEERLQIATRVACELAEHIDKNSKVQLLSIMSLSGETKRWVIEHREIDRRRLEVEAFEANKAAIKSAALAKLTPEEKKALNISEYAR